jgi:hypothetical protein
MTPPDAGEIGMTATPATRRSSDPRKTISAPNALSALALALALKRRTLIPPAT